MNNKNELKKNESSKYEEKLRNTTKDMENIIANINRGILNLTQIKSTLEIMVEECKDVLK